MADDMVQVKRADLEAMRNSLDEALAMMRTGAKPREASNRVETVRDVLGLYLKEA